MPVEPQRDIYYKMMPIFYSTRGGDSERYGVSDATTALNSAVVRVIAPVFAAIEYVLTGPPWPTVPLWTTIKGFSFLSTAVRWAKTYDIFSVEGFMLV
jgi:hypothetical protein